MPEAPEISAHAERMTKALGGSELKKFELLNFASLKTFSPAADAAVGQTLNAVEQRGKYLLLRFSGDLTHAVHLMQGGRLRADPKRSKKPRFGMARWHFDNDEAWLLTEAGSERKAGVWALEGEPLGQEPLNKLGPDAAALTAEQLKAILSEQSKRLHGVLRNQRTIAGLGRMLANEICFAAGLSPFANAAKLSEEQQAQLFDAISSVQAAATDNERKLDDIGKSIDRPSKVHNRQNKPCEECNDTIRTVSYRNYTVYYCPTQQTDGKILADNTTSKFLK